MTKVSDTVIAHGSAYAKPTRSSNIDIESIKSSMSGDGSDLDFDLSSSADDATQQPEKDDDSEDTLAPDYESTLTQARVKTINPNDHLSNKISGKSDDEQASKEPKKEPWDDLTIVPGQDNSPDEK